MTDQFTPNSWLEVKEALLKALEYQGEARRQFLDELARTDRETAEAVEGLVSAHERGADWETLPAWKPNTETELTRLAGGHVLGERFEIIELIGAGGSGEVYRAQDRHRGMQVALKTVSVSPGGDERSLAALRNELNTASQVTHPNVCRLFDITIPLNGNGPAFITMELLAGETLAQRLDRKELEGGEALVIASGIVAGLEAAHNRNIVHGDLKPGNIMLVRDDGTLRPVILDFGLAKDLNQQVSVLTERSGEWCAGTPAFMAPEVLDGKRGTVASDIHSLGVILFNMVTGRLPFEADSPLAIALKRLNGRAPLAREFAPQVDRRWEYAIARCLDKDPEKRPASASDVLRLLNAKPPFAWLYRKFVPAAAAAIAVGIGLTALRPEPVKQEARDALDHARVAMENHTREGFETAIQKFKQATEQDPRWAAPWAELASAYASESNWRYVGGKEALRQAEAAANRALLLDPNLARAHAALGWVRSLDFDNWIYAERSFKKALELDPGDGMVRYWFAVHLRKKGRFQEAERQIDEALTLTHREVPSIWTERAFLLWTEGKLSEFESHMADQLIAFRNDNFTRFMYARMLKLRGQFDDALKELEFSQQLGQKPSTVLAERASLYVAAGKRELAEKDLARLIELQQQGEEIDGLVVAGVYASLGKTDEAFEQLYRAYDKRDNTLLSAATSPALKSLHADPRFKELLRKLHYSDQIMQQIGLRSSSVEGVESQPRSPGTV